MHEQEEKKVIFFLHLSKDTQQTIDEDLLQKKAHFFGKVSAFLPTTVGQYQKSSSRKKHSWKGLCKCE